MLELKNIKKDYMNGKEIMQKVLFGIDLTIKDGDFFAIMGPSGSGKSTLMNIIGLLDTPTSGEYILNGKTLPSLDENAKAQLRSKKIGFVFQAYNLIPRIPVLDQVTLPLSYQGVPKAEQKERAIKALEKVGLAHKIHSKPNQLSGGEQQRVAIARAIITNPTLILADEPTGNLDTKTSYEIMDIFTKLNKEGKTIIMVTHEHDIAAFAKHNVHMRDGLIEKVHIDGKEQKVKNGQKDE
ncbi:MAG: ABC transporter ATP-binding protein [Candidatus Absconditabacterales bacterium]